MARLDKLVGEAAYDDIIATTEPSPVTTTIKLAESEGPLERGTVMVATAAGEETAPAKAALNATDAVYILAEGVEKAASGDYAEAYAAGNFVTGRLKTAEAYELTAADLETLRKSGILTRDTIEDPAKEGF